MLTAFFSLAASNGYAGPISDANKLSGHFVAKFGEPTITSQTLTTKAQKAELVDKGYYYFLSNGRKKSFLVKKNIYLVIYGRKDVTTQKLQTTFQSQFGSKADIIKKHSLGKNLMFRVKEGENPGAVVSALTFADKSIRFISPVLANKADKDELAVIPNIIVRIKKDQKTAAVIASLKNQYNLSLVSKLSFTDLEYEFKINETISDVGRIFEITREVASLPSIKWAEPNFLVSPKHFFSPNDTYYTSQWHLNNTGQNGAAVDADIDAPEGWDISTGSSTVIAVYDDGVDVSHEDLVIWSNPGETGGGKESNGIDDDGNGYIDDYQGWDFGDGDNTPSPALSTDNHGTSVAGVAGARGNNSQGVTGSAIDAVILPVRSGSMSCADFGNAMRYAGKYADVVNNSWGISACQSELDSAISDVVNGNIAGARRGTKGTPVLFASGNSASGWKKFTLTGFSGGSFQFRWLFIKDGSTTEGDDTVWLDDINWPGGSSTDFESDTVGSVPSGFTSGGNANWSVVSDGIHARGASGKSVKAGSISHSQQTYLDITKTVGTGSLTFWVWVSSEQNYDFFELYVNGTRYFQFAPGQYGHVNSVGYPASNADTIAIGASNDGGISGTEERSNYSQFGSELDVVAPSSGGGQGIYTTDRMGAAGYDSSNYNSSFGGTSSATPLVAGVVADLISYKSTLTAADIRTILRDGSDEIGPYAYASGRNDYYGYGRVNLFNSLNLAASSNTSPSVTVDAPNGGETWSGSQNILWTVTDAEQTGAGALSATLYYGTSSTGPWTQIATGQTCTSGSQASYSWDTTAVSDGTYWIRAVISDGAGGSGEDVSNASFTVYNNTNPSVTVNAPNGGETWSGTQNILWTATDAEQTGAGALSATLYYGTSSTGPWTQIAIGQTCTSGTQASYSWNTTSVSNGTYWIRVVVSDGVEGNGEDISNASFSILNNTNPSVTVNAPNGGETWSGNQNITWTATDAEQTETGALSATLYYGTSSTGPWTQIVTGQTCTSGTQASYSWNTTSVSNGTYWVRVVVSDGAGGSDEDVSNASFTIFNNTNPAITVNAPNGGETWSGTQNILWTATDAEQTGAGALSATLYYGSSSTGPWTQIATGQTCTSGTQASYSWNTTAVSNGTYWLRIIVSDGAGGSGEDVSNASFTVTDTTPPTGSITINLDAPLTNSTSITLTLSATDVSGVVEMQFSSDNISYTTPEPYATTKAWTLDPTDGTKTVYVKFKDSAGNWSPSYPLSSHIRPNTITLDTIPPTGTITIDAGAAITNTTSITLIISASDKNGISQMRLSNNNITWSTPEPYTQSKSWTLTSGDETKTVYVKFKDYAENWSTVYSDTIVLDSTAPSITTVSLSSGTRGVSYSQTISASGGIPPYAWSLSSGNLPPDLSLDAGTGTIMGIPTTTSGFNFTVQVTDANSVSNIKSFSITVQQDNERLFVVREASTGGSEISEFLLDGTFVRNYGVVDMTDVSSRAHIVISNANLFVNESIIDTQRILQFDSAGVFVRAITPDSSTTPRVGSLTSDFVNQFLFFTDVDAGSNVVRHIDDLTTGQSSGFATIPGGSSQDMITSHATVNLFGLALGSPYIVDYRHYERVYKLDSSGNIVDTFESAIFDLGYVTDAGSLAIHPISGNLFVVSGSLNKANPDFGGSVGAYDTIIEFDITTGLLLQSFTPQPGLYIDEITFDSGGNLYVNYYSSQNVYVYDTSGSLLRTIPAGGTVHDVFVAPALGTDVTLPTGTISINLNAAYTKSTSVSLTLSATDSNGISQMGFSNDNLTWSSAEAYATSKEWTLTSGDGTKTVYARFKDNYSNWSSAYSATIVLDTTAPVAPVISSSTHPNEGTWYTNDDPTFSWTEPSDSSGISGYSYILDQTLTTTPDTTSEGTATTKSYTNVAGSTWYFHVRALDGASNWGGTDNYIININSNPSLTVNSPNGGESWSGTQSITWTATDAEQTGADALTATLYYGTSSTGPWIQIATGQTCTSGTQASYSWDTTSVSDGTYWIRAVISDGAGGSGEDVSNASFTVSNNTNPSVIVNAPNGGENWADTQNIQWTATDSEQTGAGALSATLYYGSSSTGPWTQIATGQTCTSGTQASYSWDTTSVSDGTYWIRAVISDGAGGSGEDVSNASFTVYNNTNPSVTVNAPNGGETWSGTQNILWTATDTEQTGADALSTTLYYGTSSTGPWTQITTGQTCTSGTQASYSWNTTSVSNGIYWVRVVTSDGAGGSGEDVSNASFTIFNNTNPSIIVNAPNGGETWSGTQNILWTATDAEQTGADVLSVTLYYGTSSTGPWTQIATGQTCTSGTQASYSWNTTSVSNGTYWVRVVVSDGAGGSDEDVSNASFTIFNNTNPAITVNAPNGGETWSGTQNILWTATDAEQTGAGALSATLYYGTSSTGPWTQIATGQTCTSGTQASYSWDTTTVADGTYWVRVVVSDGVGGSGEDVSNASFTVDNPTTYYVNGSCGNDSWNGTSQTCSSPNGPKATIQAAIDVASNGDIIIVTAGTYTENINFNGKSVTLRTTVGATIDGNSSGRVVTFNSGEGSGSVLDGFTITNGNSNYGGGIYCNNSSSPSITNCTINGNSVTEDGAGIYCKNSSSPSITNCKISNNTPAYMGGGVFCAYSSSPAIINCTIDNNTASYGGGIACIVSSSPTITNCTINSNSATWTSGGGIYCSQSSPIITNSTISGNSAINASGKGGGLYCDISSPIINNVTISNNSSTLGGGGVYCQNSSSPLIANSIISGNSANDGGGFYCSSSSLLITNCTVTGNTASSGGGFYCKNSSSPYISNTILWNNGSEIFAESYSNPKLNYCDIQGGYPGFGNIDADPLFVDAGAGDYHLQPGSPCIDKGHTRIYDSDMSRSDMGAYGGGGGSDSNPVNIIVDIVGSADYTSIQDAIDYSISGDTITVLPGTYNENLVMAGKNVSIISQDGANSTIVDGAGLGTVIIFTNVESNVILQGLSIKNGLNGILCINSSPSITYCIITGNAADSYSGGGISCRSNSSPTITNCTINNNSANRSSGGGIYSWVNSSPSITNSTISSNSANDGGGISGLNVISNSTINNNSATRYGGGFYTTTDTDSISPTITNCVIRNNSAGSIGSGGGIYCTAPMLLVTDSLISSNWGNHYGGGIRCSSSSISNSIFRNNSAYSGGGIYCGTSTITNCLIKGNSANNIYSGSGGGIYCYSSQYNPTSPVIINSIITGNTAVKKGAGIYCGNLSSPKITNCSISGNLSEDGGGFYSWDSSTIVINSIFWGNIASISDNEIALGGTSSITITYSDIEGGYTGTGNINSGPLFVNGRSASEAPTTAGDYHIQTGSPCIDAANSDNPAPVTDIEGNSRYDDTGTPNTGTGANGDYYDMGAYENQNNTPPNTNPSITVNAPNGGETWSGSQNILWTATDAEQTGADALSATLYYGTSATGPWTQIATGQTCTSGTQASYSWDTTSVSDGTYWVRIVVSDGVGGSGEDVSDGSFDIYDGTSPWSRTYDGGYDDYTYAVVVDSSNNNIIVVGATNNATNEDWLIQKYNSAGTRLWSQTYDGGNVDYATGVTIDSSSNIIVAGSTWNGTDYDLLVRKYDSNGVLLWTQTYDGGIHERARDIVVDNNDNIIVVGYKAEPPNWSNYDWIIRKYDPAGTLIWSQEPDFRNNEAAYAVTVDSSNNIIVAGYSHEPGTNWVIQKYNSGGALLWTQTYPIGGGGGGIWDIAIDGNGNIIAVGSDNIHWAVRKYDPNGNIIWNKTFSAGIYDGAQGVAIDSSNNIVVSGRVYDGANWKCLIRKYCSSTGNLIWNHDYSDYYVPSGYPKNDIVIDSNSNLIVVRSIKVGSNYDWWLAKEAPSNEVCNTVPSVIINAPNGGESWSGTQNILWTATDAEQTGADALTATLYYGTSSTGPWTQIVSGRSCTSGTQASYSWDTSSLSSGTYWVRVAVSDGVTGSGEDISDASFSIAEGIPPGNVTNLQSSSHTIMTWSNDSTIDVSWTAATDTGGSGLDGYSILWNTSPTTLPDTTKDIEETATSATSSALANSNSHYLHIRSVDNAGNWASAAVHIGPFYIDTSHSGQPGANSSTP